MSWLEYNKKVNKTVERPAPVPNESQKLVVVPPSQQDEGRENRLYEVKRRVHHCLLERLDLTQLEELDEKLRAKEIRQAISILLEEEKEPLNMRERARLAREMEFEILGLGPLEPLLLDPAISDILVNRYNQVYVERKGCLELTEVRFQDNEHLLKIINKIVSNVGRRIDESVPMVDARLPDGSRVNAIISPLTLDGPMLSIRRFSVQRPSLEDLIAKGSLTAEIGETLKSIAVSKLNVLISGGTGAGKTTLLNILSGYIPATERIITIEDSAELQLQQDHVCRLETRPANIEGKGEVTQRELVKNCLRMRPDRVIVGEVRGAEVIDMLTAMNTGHEGSMTTVHANTARDALLRLETMISLSGITIQEKAMRQMISASIDVVIQLVRLSDGVRRMMALSEITGMESGVISMQDIFVFERQGMDEHGKILGRFVATGVRPRFVERCRLFGSSLPDGIFVPPERPLGRF
ncbi:MAG TPA: CpaF family protein [Desulfobaccales bacterium]|jgi:pilus assembly protein CpaF|nr:CpaF family protein [Desulfobaccales bacterium]